MAAKKKISKTSKVSEQENTEDIIQDEAFDKEAGSGEPLKKDTQRQNWFLTINNPLPDFSHEKIYDIVYSSKAFRNAPVYMCLSNEIGENSTPHTHILLCFAYSIRFSTVQKAFSAKAHIDALRGTISQTADYIAKRGTKWENDKKHDTQVDDNFEKTGQSSFHEYGKMPASTSGKKLDMAELYNYIRDGYTDAEILEINKDWLFHINKIREARSVILAGENAKQENSRVNRRTVHKYYYYGNVEQAIDFIYQIHSNELIYVVPEYKNPFDRYDGQKVIIFPYFEGQIKLSDMMLLSSGLTSTLSARYSSGYGCFEHVYLVSLEHIDNLYGLEQSNRKSTWMTFQKSFEQILHFHNNKVDVDYLGKDIVAIPSSSTDSVLASFGMQELHK